MSIKDFTLTLDQIEFFASDLARPESILAEKDGTLWISDQRGIMTRRDPDGTQELLGDVGHEPNGLAMDSQGNLYNANIGDGKIYKVQKDGSYEVILEEIDGQPLGAVNFVFVDSQDRLWISVSTREPIWFMAAAAPRPDGYVILMDKNGARIVGDGIYFPNEIRLDADEKYLYVAETMKARMIRYPVNADGTLGEQELFGPDGLAEGGFVDGFALDADGNVWVTTILRNGLMIITADGQHAHTVFEDVVQEAISSGVAKVEANTLTPDDMFACLGPNLQFPASVTFCGPDLKTVLMGSLAMPHLLKFESPIAGLPMNHW
ncbi:MAG: SMP-30/gluconolactonase/LRE family protein [Anaerolineales bacterium]|nr:SMP-30/gluconolactonase/LRE family protein [Anaerolineales bacterium]